MGPYTGMTDWNWIAPRAGGSPIGPRLCRGRVEQIAELRALAAEIRARLPEDRRDHPGAVSEPAGAGCADKNSCNVGLAKLAFLLVESTACSNEQSCNATRRLRQ
jgi:hypothetical protein